jgi:hypothetical protein
MVRFSSGAHLFEDSGRKVIRPLSQAITVVKSSANSEGARKYPHTYWHHDHDFEAPSYGRQWEFMGVMERILLSNAGY